jgi:hypothetical protein
MRTTVAGSSRIGLVATALAALAACGGRVVSLGTTGMMSMSLDELTGNVPFCAVGAAHRNACCHAGAGGDAECGIYPRSPFHSCDPEWTTYPVPVTCCDLADPTQCGAPPAAPPSPPPGRCVYDCPPGYSDDDLSGNCCQGGSSSNGTSSQEWALCIPSETIAAGASSTTCDYACPPGWQKSSNAPDVCVNGNESFSQATGAGAASSGAVSNPGSGSGATWVQDPAGTANLVANDGSYCSLSGGRSGGHTYSVTCSNVTQICTCTEDSTTRTVAGVTVCQASDNGALVDLWLQGCGFPQ